MAINLNDMTVQEKMEAMELLWDDMCRNTPDFSSPAWHEDILQEREQNLREGKDTLLSWEQVKKDIRETLYSFSL